MPAVSSFEAFADAYRTVRDLGAEALLDSESGAALVFADVCAERARLAATSEPHPVPLDDADAHEWSAEQHTWTLFHLLFAERLAGGLPDTRAPPSIYETPLAAVQRVIAATPELTELKIVRKWLEDILPAQHAVEVRKGYLTFTRNRLRADRRLSIGVHKGRVVQQLDPDAAVRGPGGWDAEDAAYERALMRNLFEYARAGQLELALDLCVQASQPWRAASLRGAMFYHDPALDEPTPELQGALGNRHRLTWRMVARRAAQNAALDPYERALYGALCGELSSVLAVSETWSERLWAHVNARFASVLEKKLAEDTPADWWWGAPAPSEPVDSLDAAFDRLAQSGAPGVQAQASAPYHMTQRAVITQAVPQLLERVAARLPELAALAPPQHARLLRFFAHVVLYCRLLGVPVAEASAAPILGAYVDILQRAQESGELVALYASSLDARDAHVSYASYLCKMDTDAPLAERRHALMQAQPHDLDPAIVARCTVAAEIAEHVPALRDEAQRDWDASLSPTEHRLVVAVDWLTFLEDTYADAIVRANELLRVFMASGRLHAAHSLLQRLPSELLSSVPALELPADTVVELDHWRSYFDVLDRSVRARGLWSDGLPATSRSARHEWHEAVAVATEAARLATLELLELDWLRIDADGARAAELALIRRRYIPEIVMNLHLMLVDTSAAVPLNLRHALALPDLVADERLRLYAEFASPDGARPNQLIGYLEQVRAAALVAMDRREDVFAPVPV